MRSTLFFLLAASLAYSAQAPKKAPAKQQQRDLKLEVDETIDPPATGKVGIPRSWAVVIGVAQYPRLTTAQQLKFTERDADDMYTSLISLDGGNFKAENVRKLTGTKATLANIKDAIENWLPSVTKDDDRVLIYFAGHGFVYEGNVYLAPRDFDPNNITRSGYSTEALGAAFSTKIKGKWKVLLTDACHSGAVNSEADRNTLNSRLKDLQRSTFSFTASRDRELSYESSKYGEGHGVFTYFVVKGIEGQADESKDGIVTADELAAYVTRNVREATEGLQNPMVGGSFNNNMLLAYIPSAAKRGNPPKPEFGGFVFESAMDGVEVYLDGKLVGSINKGAPLTLPGIAPGVHSVKGVRMGYSPDGPKEEIIYPGQQTTVTFKFLIPIRRPKAALDKFDDAVERYHKARGADGYRRAVKDFEEVLTLDKTYSEAWMFLGRANRDLTEYDKASKAFLKALELAPDFHEARTTYAGMLFDRGDYDQAIRELNTTINRDKENAMAYYLIAQVYRVKEQYDLAIESAEAAVKLTPKNSEAHFWLAEGLRGAKRWNDAIAEYREYLKLSNFDSSAFAKFGYYAIGFKLFTKKRAGTTDVWKELRALTYFGLCDAERRVQHYDNSIAYCQKALSFDQADPLTHYALALAYVHQANAINDKGMVVAAKKHFNQMLTINPDLAEGETAKTYMKQIDAILAQN